LVRLNTTTKIIAHRIAANIFGRAEKRDPAMAIR
jgi:hypothetical protein